MDDLPLDGEPLCTLCHPTSLNAGKYGSVCNDLHLYYLIGGIVTIVSALFVIVSYLFIASLRRHPSILMFMRCCADLLFGVCLIITVCIPIDRMFCPALHNEHISPCRVLGPLMMFAFQCSIYFFSASLYDLYKSIKNPFAKPHAGTKRLIFLVLFASLMLTLSIEYVFDAANVAFAYRADIQLCWIRPISYDTVNPINAVFVFTPVSIIISVSMAINIYAFLRLRQGLPDTFAIRMRSVRDSFAYSVGFTLYFIPLGVMYYLIWSNDKSANSVDALLKQHASHIHATFALLFGCFGFISAFLWWLRKLRRRDVKRLYDARLDRIAALALDPSDEFLNERQVRKSITERIKLEKLQKNVSRQKSNNTRPMSDLQESILVPERPAKLYKQTPRSSEHAAWRNSINFGVYRRGDADDNRNMRSWWHLLWSEFSFRANNKDDSNINKALRREVLAYTTDGIAQSIDHACKLNEIKQREYVQQLRTTIDSYSAMMHDDDIELDEEQLFAMILVHIPTHLDEEDDNAKIHRFGIYIQYNCALLYKDNRSNIVSDSQVISLCSCFGSRADKEFDVQPPSFHEPSLNRVTTSQVMTNRSMHQLARQNHGMKMGKERQFVDYAPLVFRYIRIHILRISDAEYRHCIIPSSEEQQREVLDAKFGDGKSGAFFYFTHNSRFIVKTIKKREMQLFLQILPDYVRYLRRNPHTILSRCVGLHSMRMYGLKKYFMVMENVFLTELKPHEIYDLKGSWVGRSTDHGVQSGKVMKDNDLKRFVILNTDNRNQIIEQLESDTMFLEQHQIMDYSLLLGIYHMKICTNNTSRSTVDIDDADDEKHLSDIEMESSSKLSMHSTPSVHSRYSNASGSGVNTYAGGVQAQVIEAPGIYYLGIIDALQKYTFRKKLETFFKTIVSGEDGVGISCVDPVRYRQRFMNYMRHIIIKDVQYFQELNLEMSSDLKPQTMLVYPAKDVIDDNMEALRAQKTLRGHRFDEDNGSFEQYQALETESVF